VTGTVGTARVVVEHNALVYRRTWQGSIFVSFISPILFLASIGVGLGSLVSRSGHTVGGVSYLAFLAPGLLVATAMQTASAETMYPIMARIQWMKTYDAMLATPVGVGSILAGEIGWFAIRLSIVSLSFFVVMLVFHAVPSVLGILAPLAAVVTGLAFAIPILAFTATQRKDLAFSVIQRFVILPLFLLGGTFFPIQKLPLFLQWVAWATPLSHGVAMARDFTIGGKLLPSDLVHLAVLLAYAAAGTIAASFTLRRRLRK
jgi:lipooligosaccharide transport system permease protein